MFPSAPPPLRSSATTQLVPLYFKILLVDTPDVSTSERPLRVVTNVGLPVKSAYAPENNVGLF